MRYSTIISTLFISYKTFVLAAPVGLIDNRNSGFDDRSLTSNTQILPRFIDGVHTEPEGDGEHHVATQASESESEQREQPPEPEAERIWANALGEYENAVGRVRDATQEERDAEEKVRALEPSSDTESVKPEPNADALKAARADLATKTAALQEAKLQEEMTFNALRAARQNLPADHYANIGHPETPEQFVDSGVDTSSGSSSEKH